MSVHLRCALLCLSIRLALATTNNGVLMLYRPRDISLICSRSQDLRFDLSFGMGMSDTITLVFRTLNEVNYGCFVEIVTEQDKALLWVIKYPTSVTRNCLYNPNAFTITSKEYCTPICSTIVDGNMQEHYETTMFFSLALTHRGRFRFESNSSINTDLNAHSYQVTATSARPIPKDQNCAGKNETMCEMNESRFCFTSGVYCDGIKNCGTTDWYDEKKLDCGLPIETLSISAVLAVVAALCLALLAGGHLMLRCLPPLANSFFIFNANEDNRLRIDPIFKAPLQKPLEFSKAKRASLVPMFSSSSSSASVEINPEEQREKLSNIEFEDEMGMSRQYREPSSESAEPEVVEEEAAPSHRTTAFQNISSKLNKLLGQFQLRAVDSKAFFTRRT